MTRPLILFCLAALAAAVLAGGAAAKEMSVSLASGPPALGPGERWNAELLVHGEPDILREASPGILIRRSDGRERTFAARPTKRRAADGQLIYRATVVFPTEGRWGYWLLDGVTDRAYHGGTLVVGDPAPTSGIEAPGSPAAVPAAADDGSFPLWPLLGGLLVAALAAGGAVALGRRSRPAATR